MLYVVSTPCGVLLTIPFEVPIQRLSCGSVTMALTSLLGKPLFSSSTGRNWPFCQRSNPFCTVPTQTFSPCWSALARLSIEGRAPT
ncbi:Uncharacterised protein [Vibrio cholerae]|nr:Uncharacterised protein [Vibrio cholerae]CSD42737.1 Uncharacterised protein [Vibrio cholerae]CSI67734.1 Uncharacterised protein [Vibrio cholerae]